MTRGKNAARAVPARSATLSLTAMQITHDEIDALLRSIPHAVEVNFRCFRRFVTTINPGKVLQLSAAGFRIKTLRIPAFTFFERCIHVDFDKLPRLKP